MATALHMDVLAEGLLGTCWAAGATITAFIWCRPMASAASCRRWGSLFAAMLCCSCMHFLLLASLLSPSLPALYAAAVGAKLLTVSLAIGVAWIVGSDVRRARMLQWPTKRPTQGATSMPLAKLRARPFVAGGLAGGHTSGDGENTSGAGISDAEDPPVSSPGSPRASSTARLSSHPSNTAASACDACRSCQAAQQSAERLLREKSRAVEHAAVAFNVLHFCRPALPHRPYVLMSLPRSHVLLESLPLSQLKLRVATIQTLNENVVARWQTPVAAAPSIVTSPDAAAGVVSPSVPPSPSVRDSGIAVQGPWSHQPSSAPSSPFVFARGIETIEDLAAQTECSPPPSMRPMALATLRRQALAAAAAGASSQESTPRVPSPSLRASPSSPAAPEPVCADSMLDLERVLLHPVGLELFKDFLLFSASRSSSSSPCSASSSPHLPPQQTSPSIPALLSLLSPTDSQQASLHPDAMHVLLLYLDTKRFPAIPSESTQTQIAGGMLTAYFAPTSPSRASVEALLAPSLLQQLQVLRGGWKLKNGAVSFAALASATDLFDQVNLTCLHWLCMLHASAFHQSHLFRLSQVCATFSRAVATGTPDPELQAAFLRAQQAQMQQLVEETHAKALPRPTPVRTMLKPSSARSTSVPRLLHSNHFNHQAYVINHPSVTSPPSSAESSTTSSPGQSGGSYGAMMLRARSNNVSSMASSSLSPPGDMRRIMGPGLLSTVRMDHRRAASGSVNSPRGAASVASALESAAAAAASSSAPSAAVAGPPRGFVKSSRASGGSSSHHVRSTSVDSLTGVASVSSRTSLRIDVTSTEAASGGGLRVPAVTHSAGPSSRATSPQSVTQRMFLFAAAGAQMPHTVNASPPQPTRSLPPSPQHQQQAHQSPFPPATQLQQVQPLSSSEPPSPQPTPDRDERDATARAIMSALKTHQHLSIFASSSPTSPTK